MCHYCGYSDPAPRRCPSCNGSLKRIGVGTQKAEAELKSIAPELEIDRMDADTVSAVNTHEKILDHFKNEHIPVLIGTQMVAKGLNLPDVTLVGVLDADLSLYSDGFRAAETTFNMLTQVVGRAGRGDTPGRAMIQTVNPEHQVIRMAAQQDYDSFYELEIGLRKMQLCPPFGDICTVTFTGQDETAVLRGAVKFRDSLNACLQTGDYKCEKCTVLGPAPCVVPKINYNFRYRLTLRCRMSRNLRLLVAHLLRQFAKDKLNRGVSAFADVNGFE
jgi:primosomal protein N' (replication factor Y)